MSRRSAAQSRALDEAAPPLDVMEDDVTYVLELPAPDIDPRTLHVEVHGHDLEIEGDRRGPSRRTPFRRVLVLPADSDAGGIDVACSGAGVRILLPKSEASKSRTRR